MLSSPFICLLLLRLPVAAAADIAVPGEKPDIGAALAIARPGDTLTLDDDDARWDAALATPLTVDLNLTIRSDDSDRVQIPGLKVSGGATLTLEHVEVAGSHAAVWSVDGTTVLNDSAAIFVYEGTLTGTDVLLSGTGEYGLLAVDSSVELRSITATNYSTARAARAVNSLISGRFTLLDCALESNAAGALAVEVPPVAAAGVTLTVSVTDCSFTHNGAARGADILANSVSLILDNGQLSDGRASIGGGSIWAEDSELTVSNSTFSGQSAPYGAAIAASATEDLGSLLTLDNVDLLQIQASDPGTAGGALRLLGTATTLEDLRAEGVSAYDGAVLYQENGSFYGSYLHLSDFTIDAGGGALFFRRYYAPWNEPATVHHSVFCDGGGAAPEEGLAVRSEGYYTEITNSVFQSLVDGDGEAVYISGAGARIDQNTFTGNSVRYLVAGNVATLSTTNNIFDHAEAGVLLVESSSSISGSYNLWNDMQDYVEANGGTVQVIDPETVLAPPMFWASFDPSDCYTDPYLAYGSPAIDAGDPSITDGDGTRSDIGAFGGPDVQLPDKDADGWAIGQDCDDADERVNPGATETWYDGFDQDCLGDDDYDADADGYPGGESGTDCDDQDPDAHPDQTETWYDGVDGDCDGQDDFDADGDGSRAEPLGGDCDDTDPLINPSMMELAGDSIDRDCDGSVGTTAASLGGGCQGCASGGAPGPGQGSLALGLLALGLLRRRGGGLRS